MPASATGTPTSPDSLATLNTSADAPDGVGINNIVASVQTALTNKVAKPSGIAAGELVGFDGTNFVRANRPSLGIVVALGG